MNDAPEDILARMKRDAALEQARRKEKQSNTVIQLPRSMTIEEVRALEALRSPKQISQPTFTLAEARMGEIAVQVMTAVSEAKAEIYQRGGRLMRPIVEEMIEGKGRRIKSASLVELDAAYLKHLLGTTWATEQREDRCGKTAD